MKSTEKKDSRKPVGKDKKKNQTSDKRVWVLRIVFILTPFILSFVLMAVKWLSQGYAALPGIKWNDEAVYIKLIQTYSHFPAPKGYWGFDANHALWGTGSAWSPAILAPYFIPALIFPVGYSFVYICNMVYVTIANALFMVLTKPDSKKLLKLILIQAASVVFILYLNTNMSEIFRYALAIVIAGLLYKMFFDKCPKWLAYIVTPLVILYSVQVYTFFAFCIPIYVFALLKNRKLWMRIVFSLFAMAFIAFASYGLLHLISSNYNIGKTENLLNAVSGGHIFTAVKSFLSMIIDGFRGLIDLRYTVKNNGIYIFHLMIAFLLVVASVLSVIQKSTSKEDKTVCFIVLYSICIFFFMYMTLYTIVPDTFMRGTEIAVIFSMYLLMMTKDKYLAWTMILCSATGLLLLPANLKNFQGEERYYKSEETAKWRELERDMKEVISVKESDDPWDNTVLMYTMEPKVILSIPEGMGLNFVLNSNYFGSDCEYLVFPKFQHQREDWIEQNYVEFMNDNSINIEYHYYVVYENSNYICYRKKDAN
ncbi:MAG: hypothetical protein K5776_00885 [Lachnospiraceae bacterium]|nr:hypothetical protein [Lachnospiraceae bacterium]